MVSRERTERTFLVVMVVVMLARAAVPVVHAVVRIPAHAVVLLDKVVLHQPPAHD